MTLDKAFSSLLAFWLFAPSAFAAEQHENEFLKRFVEYAETDESDCMLHGGKLISLKLVDTEQSLEVWVDRWYLGVKTPDHTKHVLTIKQPISTLGCSVSRSGPQHWTIDIIKPTME